jgi:V/A-type H+-transporting ATPase subunit I
MIVPMSKYSFLIYHGDRTPFMQKLMDIGVLHVISKGAVEDDLAKKLSSDITLAEQVLKSFKKRTKSKKNQKQAASDYPLPTMDVVPQLEKKLEDLEKEKASLQAQIKLLEPWGEFSWDRIAELENKTGVAMRFCQHPSLQFKQEWHDDHPIEIVNQEQRTLYFIVFQEDENSKLPVLPLALPKRSLSELKNMLAECEQQLNSINQELDYYAVTYSQLLKDSIAKAKDDFFLHHADLSLEPLNDDKVLLIEGWCPKTVESELQKFIKEENIVFIKQKPTEDDEPPVLLKNNRFSKLFEPIGNLFSLPSYTELDLTAFFAPFFFLFFGFCLGDAGYGAVFLIIGSLLKLKIKGPNRNYLTLIQLFGISTIVVGYFSGTLFGLQMANLPFFASQKDIFLNQNELFQVALAIGFVQIVFGMGVQVYKQVIFHGWIYAISKIGWIILSLSLLDIFISNFAPQVSGITVWIGVALIVFFGSPDSGWLKSFGFGLADLYNITGAIGDILSYIRLFALGVSSAILGLVVNSIALSAKGVPYVGILLFVIILIVGHTANLMLASLSAFVHPMRLTFVEFYKNTGFIGGGKPYNPLARKAPKEK